jgi:hypothetical protein
MLDGARQHFETLHGIVPGLFTVRVAPFGRPFGTFSPAALSPPRHRDGNEKHRIYLLLFSLKSTLMVLLKSSAPLSQLVFNNKGRFRYRAGSITCNVTGIVASL